MASYRFSALVNGQHINFNPQQDLLFFDNAALSAASLEIGASVDGAGTTFSLNGKTLTLDGVQSWELVPVNFKFANGSQFVSGNLSNNFSHSLTGTTGADLLLGSAPTQTIELASTRTDGVQGNGGSPHPVLSADGRFVAFESEANNLVAGDTNNTFDIFVKDLQTGEMQRVSTDSGGVEGNGFSANPALSADGRFVAFESLASNLVAGDTNGTIDIFVKNLQTGQTLRVSTDNGGVGGNNPSQHPTLSADGRFVAFHSFASNLVPVPGDMNSTLDIFVKDLLTGQTQRVSTDSGGVEGNSFSATPALSADGRFVGFQSLASNLVAGDMNGAFDIFVKNLQTGQTQRVSTDSGGVEGNSLSAIPALSADGRLVAFLSFASNLVAGDTNGTADIFVKDLLTGQTQRVSTDSGGVESNSDSQAPTLSADGRFVAFYSGASNLVAGDTNNTFDIFVKDLQTGQTRRVSTDSLGIEGNGTSSDPTLSADGSFVAFFSRASNLVAGDVNGQGDIFTLSNPLQQVTLSGGIGNDSYVINSRADRVVEASGEGLDTVRSSISYILPANVENLTLTGTGNLNATGNTLNNVLTGNDGNNVLNGGAGIDTVSYAYASDSVTVDLSITQAQETVAAGLDRLVAIENLTGSAFDDALSGTVGANVLDGGAGADTLVGGAGNDVYGVDSAGDVVVESVGIDRVQSAISYSLGAGLENLMLTGTKAISGAGNAANNVIAGNAGNNLLDGGAGIDTASYAPARVAVTVNLALTTIQFTSGAGADTLLNFENLTGSAFNDILGGNAQANVIDGGLGADAMAGGAGDDTYFVNNAADQITELDVGGIDTVQSSITWTLGAETENLRLTGMNAINGAGNAGNNVIYANDANNTLDGAGGIDTLSYAYASAGVTVNLGIATQQITGGSGTDTVLRFENLTGSNFADNFTGNSAANTLIGGIGADILTGGGGADLFTFTSKVGVDTLTDFISGIDKLRFSQAGVRVGDGDTTVEQAATIAGPGGFANNAELVIVTGNIAGAINSASAAAAIGSATSAYVAGNTALFTVDNGVDTGLFLFTSSGADALVSAAELIQIVSLTGVPATAQGDYQFMA